MRARTWVARCAVWLSAAAAACGDTATPSVETEAAPSTPDAGSPSPVSPDAGDAVESGDSNAGTPDAGATDNPLAPFSLPCDPAGDGACQNDTDCDSISSGRAAEGSQICGACLLMIDPVPCFEECLVPAAGLSSSCSTCFAELAGCGLQFCAAPCVADVAGEACRSCRDENGCSESFVSCGGVAL